MYGYSIIIAEIYENVFVRLFVTLARFITDHHKMLYAYCPVYKLGRMVPFISQEYVGREPYAKNNLKIKSEM